MNQTYIILIILVIVILYFLLGRVIALFITARFAGVPIPFMDLLAIKIRRSDLNGVVDNYIILKKAGVNASIHDIEVSLLAGRNMENIRDGLIKAKELGSDLPYKEAVDADKAGKNIVDELNRASDANRSA